MRVMTSRPERCFLDQAKVRSDWRGSWFERGDSRLSMMGFYIPIKLVGVFYGIAVKSTICVGKRVQLPGRSQ